MVSGQLRRTEKEIGSPEVLFPGGKIDHGPEVDPLGVPGAPENGPEIDPFGSLVFACEERG